MLHISSNINMCVHILFRGGLQVPATPKEAPSVCGFFHGGLGAAMGSGQRLFVFPFVPLSLLLKHYFVSEARYYGCRLGDSKL